MKLTATKNASRTTYPTFQDYWERRQKYLGSLAVSAGVAVGASMLTGCQGLPPPTMPPEVTNQQPAPQTNCTVRLSGEPTAVNEPELRLRGDIAEPQPPAREPQPALKGKPAPPTPPAK